MDDGGKEGVVVVSVWDGNRDYLSIYGYYRLAGGLSGGGVVSDMLGKVGVCRV